MNIAGLSIKRPIFITCLFLLILILGYISLRRIPVDLYPDVTFPVITVNTVYPGASPREIETLISKPLEDEISTIAGIKKLSSVNKEGVSTVIVEFFLGTDIKDAEQQVRNHISLVRNDLPDEIEEPIIYRLDPASQPIIKLSLVANMPEGQLYDLADEVIAPQIQQVNQVGLVEILGGRKREIHVKMDLEKLKQYRISASELAQKIALSGRNVPIGKVDEAKLEQVFRLVGEFPSVQSIQETIVRFTGNDIPIRVSDVATVTDTLEDEKSRTFVNGNKGLILNIYKQSKANTVAVTDGIKEKVGKIQKDLADKYPNFQLSIVQDGSKIIHDNIFDVKESITLGIILTVIVVFFFLGNFRSTIITGLSLPNSLLGAFILMAWAGFSINMMSLLALSLSVGLLIDDAIVVRENIFRHIELGEKPMEAAIRGTNEVLLAVIATTFTIIAVFGPIGFLQGLVGQFFKEFGLTVCFAMLISLFDAVTMAPMLSAYFAGKHHAPGEKQKHFILFRPLYWLLAGFNKFQDGLEYIYEKFLGSVLRHPLISLFASFLIFLACVYTINFIPKTFLPPQDSGEFAVQLEMEPGTNLGVMSDIALEIDKVIRQNPQVKSTVLTSGDRDGQSNVSYIYVLLVPQKDRTVNTTQMKDKVREQLKSFKDAAPKVTDVDWSGGGQRPFNLHLTGSDLEQLEKYATQVYEKLKKHPALQDPEISHKPGKPEVQLAVNEKIAHSYGISSAMIGQEVRIFVEGSTPAIYREKGLEYDVRLRVEEDQRNLRKSFDEILVPNINQNLVPLDQVATLTEATSPVTINRENRERYINIAGDIAPNSVGVGGLIQDIQKLLKDEMPMPSGIGYSFVGEAENFQELIENMAVSLALGVIFIYFVLASLYESFITPFTIMLVLPLAACGAFLALFVTQQSLDIYSMIGCILLMGVATKNSILLVDYTNQLMAEGVPRREAIIKAGKVRLRPILMTSLALIAGMIPVAVGLNEASQQRVSMGISVIGGVISSTLLTLIVIPAAFTYIDRFNNWIKRQFMKISAG